MMFARCAFASRRRLLERDGRVVALTLLALIPWRRRRGNCQLTRRLPGAGAGHSDRDGDAASRASARRAQTRRLSLFVLALDT